MADDDDYVEGDSSSAPADAPGAIPADDAPERGAQPEGDIIDSASVQEGTPVQRMGRSTARTAQARKAFAEAILANKAKPPAAVNEDQEDPEDVALAAAEKPAPAAPIPAPAAPAAAPPPAAEPPAPSLHPEVLKLKQQLEQERAALAAKEAELAKAATPAPLPDASSLEDYIDSPSRAYRTWLESMRGEKFATDDEFKAEVSDFVTQMSADVLGVPLPDGVRTKLEAAQARKAVRASKTIQSKREAAAAAKAEQERAAAAQKAETERVETEWIQAAKALTSHFAPKADAAGALTPSEAAKAYPWLAAEDDPGKIVVDVIRAAVAKDGTQLAWQEASKRANDYLEAQAKQYYDRRKPLLAGQAPAAKPAAPVAKPPQSAVPAPPPATPPQKPQKWSRDRHLDNTKAAFRAALAGKTQ